MVKYCELFWTFLKVGTFTIGGGYAMLPLMQSEVVDRRRWLSEAEFLDEVAISQALPGVFAVNMASVIGNRLRGPRGAVVAVVGNIMMPVMIILLLAVFFRAFRDNEYVGRVFLGLRPAVVALVAAPVFRMASSSGITWRNAWIPVVCTLLVWLLGVSPVVVVLTAALLGYVYSLIVSRR